MFTRRQVLKLMGRLSATSALLPMRRVSIATAGMLPPDPRLVVTLLRGGLDGLAVVPPYGDPDFAQLRPEPLRSADEETPGVIELDGQFGLHPEMAPLKSWYDAGEMLIIHATGIPSHHRSHFAAQHLLERGGESASAGDGWLNRALGGLPQGASLGLTVGRAVPLILQGQTEIRSILPPRLPKVEADFLQCLDELYAVDPLFQQTFEKARPLVNEERGLRWRWDPTVRRPTFRVFTEEAAKLLANPDGPRVAVLESHGWDTHVQQSAQLPDLLAQFVDGLEGLRENLEPVWQQTVVLVVTEFGRTVQQNRSAGTDHGVGGVALALGGAVAGGRVGGTWPGLTPSGLLENRDLRPTTDLRALFKAALRDHLGLDESFMEDHVFPNSRTVAPFAGLIRSF
jgi:uncharacterized protein (DUF1501 family)